MIPSRYPQNLGKPWANFVTTYGQDYRPYEERHLQVGPGTAWSEAQAVYARVKPPQTHFQIGTDNWPLSVRKCFYKTTNSTYGSGCWTPEQTSSYPVLPFVSEPSAVRLQDASVEENRQLQLVFGGKANTLGQREAKVDPQPEVEVYDEGVVLLLCPGGGGCSRGCLGCACREAVLQCLLHPSGTSGPVVTVKGGDAVLLRSAAGLKHGAAPQAGPRHCTCWLCPARFPLCCCPGTQSAPGGGMWPLQPVVEYREPIRNEWVTEYRASYVTPWTKPRV